jgi:hypothetical protein
VAFHEWMAMGKDVFSGKKSLRDRAKYIVKPPGWKHDGTGKVSNDLRKEWRESVGSIQPARAEKARSGGSAELSNKI